MRQVAAAHAAEKSYGFDVQDVTVEEILAKAQDHVAREARQDDRRPARGQVLLPGGPADVANDGKNQRQLDTDKRREQHRRGAAGRPILEREKIQPRHIDSVWREQTSCGRT
jgi:hypothetical protein